MVFFNILFENIRVYDRNFDWSEDIVCKFLFVVVYNYFFFKGMDMLCEGGILVYIMILGVMDFLQNCFVREWLMNYVNFVFVSCLLDNFFVDVGMEVGSDLIVLQKNIKKIELIEKEWNFIEICFVFGGININNCYFGLDYIVYIFVFMGKNMYG